jgi:hypothetical protein
MSELTPPPSLPPAKDTFNIAKKNFIIIILSLFITVLVLVLAIRSSDSSQDSNTTVPVTQPIPTNPPPAIVNKYDAYMDHVLNNSGQANTWSKAEVIEFGDLVCGALDNNTSIRSVVNLLNSYAKTNSDVELFASVMIGSIRHICPEYQSDLNYYLNN